MKDNTLHLEIYKQQNSINVSLHKSKSVIWTYKTVVLENDQYTPHHIDDRCKQMINALNRYTMNGEKKQDSLNEIKSLGNILSDELLPDNIKQKLMDTNATYLLLFIDDHLVHIPWELICIGDQFLCERFCMGRLVKTRQQIIESEDRPLNLPVNMWIVADPKNDLPYARQEGKDICDLIDDINNENENIVINGVFDSHVNSSDVKEKIRHFDFIHHTGHSYYDSDSPDNSGWELPGKNFTANDIVKMTGTQMPKFIFSNACQSARTDKWTTDHSIEKGSYGLANSFMLTGVKHYIGTSWDINDGASSDFTAEFYRQLFNGEPIGKAMNKARRMLMDPDDFDICWASYVLYGDPHVRYLNVENDNKVSSYIKGVKSEKTIYKNNRSFLTKRGGKVGWNFLNIKETRNWLILFLFFIGFLMTYSLMDNYIQAIKNIEKIKVLSMHIDQMQKDVDLLFQKLIDKFGPLNPPKCKSISVYFESQINDRAQKKLIAAAIESEINKRTGFIPLATDLVSLRRIIINLLSQKPPINYQLPELMLFFDTYKIDSQSTYLVVMKLVNAKTGRTIIDHFFEYIDKQNFILIQKESLCLHLIEVLNKKFPVKGKIINIKKNCKIEANIGQCDGIKELDQTFLVENSKLILKPLSIRSESCDLTIANGLVMPQIGDSIIMINQ
ncbi:CHAT domain protein [Candidatus Magnetomorum sp. HK-1]|nr:CHAT domain protein [Candidatus Magnetomorum sp. HK-1]